MKAVYIMWTGGVDQQEYGTSISTVKEVFRLLYGTARHRGFVPFPTHIRAFGTWVVPTVPRGAPFWSTYWYVAESYDRGSRRIVGPQYLAAIREEPWQRSNPHYDLAITEFDLAERQGSEEGEYVMGSVLPGVGAIVSVLRVRFALEGEGRLLAIRRLVAHHLAQAIKAPLALGRTEKYCTNICALRPTPSVEELAKLALEESQAGVLLCQDCREQLLDAILLAERSLN